MLFALCIGVTDIFLSRMWVRRSRDFLLCGWSVSALLYWKMQPILLPCFSLLADMLLPTSHFEKFSCLPAGPCYHLTPPTLIRFSCIPSMAEPAHSLVVIFWVTELQCGCFIKLPSTFTCLLPLCFNCIKSSILSACTHCLAGCVPSSLVSICFLFFLIILGNGGICTSFP